MKSKIRKIILDNGHGVNTCGKSSPDGKLKEYAWSREIVNKIASLLRERGFDAHILVPEPEDIPLKTRVNRVNKLCRETGSASKCVLVSVHVNAAGNGLRWLNPHGWSVFVGMNASENSKRLGNIMASTASAEGLYVRKQKPNQGYWQQSLAMVRDTLCPAVLTENLFMDNQEDCAFLLSPKGKKTIVRLHVDALSEYVAA